LGATGAVVAPPPFVNAEDWGIPNVSSVDCELNDSTPFDCEEDLDLFHDAETWDDDSEPMTVVEVVRGTATT
jgi:hypothetical protein